MPQKKKIFRQPARRYTLGRKKKKESAETLDSGLTRCLNDLAEQVDIMVPEVTARIAALEHLLLEKRLCTREELRHAREFVRIQEED